MTRAVKKPVLVCTPKLLPAEHTESAAQRACEINPANAPMLPDFSTATGFTLQPQHIAVLTSRYWGSKGVKLGVYFMDNPAADLKARILQHANAWGQKQPGSNVQFMEASASSAQVRIARQRGDGYWSYLGTDVLQIPRNEPTMNLDSFSMSTPDSEFYRVVRHEVGHTLGCPHEHMRRAIIAKLDAERTIAYFMRTQGWSRQTVIQQVLTPLEEASIMGTPDADETSVMCYQISGECTKDGKPIIGGKDIMPADVGFISKIYPLAAQPPPPENGTVLTLSENLKAGTYKLIPA